MFILDENKLRMLHNLMREKGIMNVDLSMFSEQQKKTVYESYGEKFLMFNGLGFMVNFVISYALAKNMQMVNKKLREELDKKEFLRLKKKFEKDTAKCSHI